MQYTEVKKVIAGVQSDLAYDTPRNSNIIKRWIFEAMNDIGCGRLIKKSVKLDLNNSIAEKPKDYVAAYRILLVKNGKEVEPEYSETFTCRSTKAKCDTKYYVSETRETFFFSDGNDFNCVILEYYSSPMINGEPAVVLEALQAIKAYCFLWDEKKNRKRNKNKAARQNPSSMNEIGYYQDQYDKERFAFRALLTSPENARQIAEIGEKWVFMGNGFPSALKAKYSEMFLKT